MNLRVGQIARFSFIAGFSDLGPISGTPNSGVYELAQIISWKESIELALDLYDTYKLVGKTRDDLNADMANYENKDIYKLKAVGENGMGNSTTVIYIPSTMLSGEPVTGLTPRYRLILALDLGPFNEPMFLSGLESSLRQVIEKDHGIKYYDVAATKNNSDIPDEQRPELFGVQSQLMFKNIHYMTDDEYAALTAARLYVKQESDSSTPNFYAEVLRLRKLLAATDANAQAYSEALKAAQLKIADLEAQLAQGGN